MTTILLARHGETDWNRDRIYQGHADPPLNAKGRRQAEALARRLAGERLDAIYASDLHRALETAEIVAAALGMTVVPEAGLREIDVGSWSGLTRDEIAERFPGAASHDGELREAFLERVLATILRIARAHPGERVLVVTHGGPVRAVQRHALGEPLPVLENCGLYGLRFESGAFRPLD